MVQLFPREDVERALKINVFEQYRDDPVGYGRNILNESYTDGQRRLMESVRDNLITVGVSANAVGKTYSAATVAIWFYKCFRRSQVYTAAAPPERNLKKLLWGEIGEIANRHQVLFEDDVFTSLNIERSTKQFITGVTIPASGTSSQREAKFSGKHSPYLLFIFDEGDAIPDEVYQGAESCISGGHARILIMFNPRYQGGYAHRLIRDNKANVIELSAFDHPNVITGENIIPGAVTRETTVRRINEWTVQLHENDRQHSANEIFEVPDYLVNCTAKNAKGVEYAPLKPGTRRIVDPAFSYMVLGQYPAQAINQLISADWIYRARARYDAFIAQHGGPPAETRPVLGLDVAEMGDDLNQLCARYGGFISGFQGWGGMDTVETGERAAQKYRELNAYKCNVDATGIGAGVAPYMNRRRCTATAVKVAESPTEKTEFGEFGVLRDQLWWMCREWLRTDIGAMLPPDEELIEELLVPTYAIVKGKIKIMDKKEMKHSLGRSPDKADALCLTFTPGTKKKVRARSIKVGRH